MYSPDSMSSTGMDAPSVRDVKEASGSYAVRVGHMTVGEGTQSLMVHDKAVELEVHIHPLLPRPLTKSVYPSPLTSVEISLVCKKDVWLLYTMALNKPP